MQNDEKLLSEPHSDQSIESYGHHVRLSQVKRYMRRNNSPRGGRFAITAPPNPRSGAEERRYDGTSTSMGGNARPPSNSIESPQVDTSWQVVCHALCRSLTRAYFGSTLKGRGLITMTFRYLARVASSRMLNIMEMNMRSSFAAHIPSSIHCDILHEMQVLTMPIDVVPQQS